MNADSAASRSNNPTVPAARPTDGEPIPALASGRGARVLVVDDDPDVLRVLGSALRLFNYEVDAAENGAVAWEALRTKPYALVVTDHAMPRLTGLDLIRRLREAGQTLPCILVSGVLPDLGEAPDPQLWPLRTMAKPVRLEDLIAAVQSLLAGAARRPAETGACVSACPA